jgi:hypothetical protein
MIKLANRDGKESLADEKRLRIHSESVGFLNFFPEGENGFAGKNPG